MQIIFLLLLISVCLKVINVCENKRYLVRNFPHCPGKYLKSVKGGQSGKSISAKTIKAHCPRGSRPLFPLLLAYSGLKYK